MILKGAQWGIPELEKKKPQPGQPAQSVVSGFLTTWCVELRPNSSILLSSHQRILLLTVWDSFRRRLPTLSRLSCIFLWGEASVWLLGHKAPIRAGLRRWLSLLHTSGAKPHWPPASGSHVLTQALPSDCSVWPCGYIKTVWSTFFLELHMRDYKTCSYKYISCQFLFIRRSLSKHLGKRPRDGLGWHLDKPFQVTK